MRAAGVSGDGASQTAGTRRLAPETLLLASLEPAYSGLL
jgi:hypothetical protein